MNHRPHFNVVKPFNSSDTHNPFSIKLKSHKTLVHNLKIDGCASSFYFPLNMKGPPRNSYFLDRTSTFNQRDSPCTYDNKFAVTLPHYK